MDYNKDSIVHLNPIEHIRKRPGMYIGSIDIEGLHHLVRESVDNVVDEYLAGYGKDIIVTIERNANYDKIIISDSGRGIPVGYRDDFQMDVLTAIFTLTSTGGKFNHSTYSTSSGCNGVGLKAITALSSYLKVSVAHKDGMIVYEQEFKNGSPSTDVTKIKRKSTRGTTIEFVPDKDIFETLFIDLNEIKKRLSFLASLLPGFHVKLIFNDLESEPNTSETILDLVFNKPLEYIHKELVPDAVKFNSIFKFEYNSESVQAILSYHQGTNESSNISFINTIHTYDGGSHVDSFIKAILDSLKRLTGRQFTKYQVTPGMNMVISVFKSDVVLKGQHKSKVADSEVKNLVYNEIYTPLFKAISASPEFQNYIVNLITSQEQVLEDITIKQAVKTIRNKTRENRLPKKLSVVYNCKPEDREIFICEGDSAGGGIKTARDPKFQEVLPIKGKIINAFKASYTDMLNSKEAVDIFLSIGGMENSNTTLRCHNLFILADSDPDGAHISALVMSLVAVGFPSFIRKHNLYLVHPPLFTAIYNDYRIYGHSVKDVKSKFKKAYGNKIPEIYRNKGLGEMSPRELKDVIDRKTRKVTKIEFNDNSIIELEKLMGSFTDVRKAILNEIEDEIIDEK